MTVAMLLYIIPILLTATFSSAIEQKCLCIVKSGVYFTSSEFAKPSKMLPLGSCFELRHRSAGSLIKLKVNSHTGYVKKSSKVKIDICTTNDSTNKLVVTRFGLHPCSSTHCQQCLCNWTPSICVPCGVCRLVSRATNCNPPLPSSYVNNNVCYSPTCLKCKCGNTSVSCSQCLSCQILPSQCLGFQIQGIVVGGLSGFINQLLNGSSTNLAHSTTQSTSTATAQNPSTTGTTNIATGTTSVSLQSLCLSNHCMTCECTSKIPYHECKRDCRPCRNYPMHCGYFRQHGYPKTKPTVTYFSTPQWTGTGITNKATGTTSLSLQSLCLSNHCMTCECTFKLPYHQCKIDCGACRNFPMHCGYFRQHGYAKTTTAVTLPSTTTRRTTTGPKSSTGNVMLTFALPPFPFLTNGPASQQG